MYQNEKWVNPKKLEKLVGIKTSTQAKMRMRNSKVKIPYSKVGKFIFYNLDEIYAWLEKNKIRGVDNDT